MTFRLSKYVSIFCGDKLYREDQLKQALRDALEQAANACDALGQKYRDLYKGRTEIVDRERLYDPYTGGMSDGAWECEDAIRKLIGEIK